MSKKLQILLALMCAILLLIGNVLPAHADLDAVEETAEEETPIVIPYTEVPLYANDEYIGTGFLIDSVTYVPMRAFLELMLQNCDAVWEQDAETATLTSEGFFASYTMGSRYMVVNGRYLFFPDDAFNINGTIVAPIRELAKIFSLDVNWDHEEWIIELDASEPVVFASGDEFYDADSLYWLSRVIHAEAGNQPLEGMIGVGNVVLNRVMDESNAFRNTIHDVIFQAGQFNVVELGGIYAAPGENAVIAAKLCLEGYNTVGDAKWFFNPKISSSTWFDKYKTFVISIEDHNFYA